MMRKLQLEEYQEVCVGREGQGVTVAPRACAWALHPWTEQPVPTGHPPCTEAVLGQGPCGQEKSRNLGCRLSQSSFRLLVDGLADEHSRAGAEPQTPGVAAETGSMVMGRQRTQTVTIMQDLLGHRSLVWFPDPDLVQPVSAESKGDMRPVSG